jgi:transcriptional regulator with XRE-family HTH domain
MPKSVYTGAHQHLVAVLVEARRKAGLTQTELATLVGKDQKFISLIERSQRRVDVIEFCALARALGAEPVSLYRDLVKRLPAKLEI